MTATYRALVDSKPSPPPPSGLPDQLDTTSRQVRLDGRDDERTVHRLSSAQTEQWCGRRYRTVCGTFMTAAEGAILTTRDTTCEACKRGGGRRA